MNFGRFFWYSVIFADTLYCQFSSDHLVCWTSFLWMLSFLLNYTLCWGKKPKLSVRKYKDCVSSTQLQIYSSIISCSPTFYSNQLPELWAQFIFREKTTKTNFPAPLNLNFVCVFKTYFMIGYFDICNRMLSR